MVARTQCAEIEELDRIAFDKVNIMNFSDAVIAIAITLLVLELRLPDLAAEGIDAMFLTALGQEMPRIVAYVVGFAVIASYWFEYQRHMKYVQKLDGRLALYNIVFLFFIALLPFPTSILGMYPAHTSVVVFYAISIICISTASYLMRMHALKGGLMIPGADERKMKRLVNQPLLNSAILVLTIPLAFVSPIAAMIAWVIAPVFSRALLKGK
jgi:uncharacterized membrane protein